MVVGDKGVGKTSMIRNFLYGNKLNTNQQPTKTPQAFKHHEKIIEKKTYFLNVIDMPGGDSNKFREKVDGIKIDKKDFHLFLFCYSLDSKKSLETIKELYQEVKK